MAALRRKWDLPWQVSLCLSPSTLVSHGRPNPACSSGTRLPGCHGTPRRIESRVASMVRSSNPDPVGIWGNAQASRRVRTLPNLPGRHMEGLKDFSHVATVTICGTGHQGGGRSGTAYWLTKIQAMYPCAAGTRRADSSENFSGAMAGRGRENLRTLPPRRNGRGLLRWSCQAVWVPRSLPRLPVSRAMHHGLSCRCRL